MCGGGIGEIISAPLRALGIIPNTPRAPNIQQAAPPPAPAPTMADPAVAQSEQRERRRAASRYGRQSTILTGAQGVQDGPVGGGKTLLGS